MRRCVLITLAMLPLSSVRAQPPAFEIGEAAGYYLVAVRKVELLRKTQCGYALPSDIASVDHALNLEILGPLADDVRRVAREPLLSSLHNLEQATSRFVGDRVAKEIKRLDKKTGCGFVAGEFVNSASAARANWRVILSRLPASAKRP
jgi:hypothetical protein